MKQSSTLLAALYALACDPGAGFRVDGRSDDRIAWRVDSDSIYGEARSSAFTINLSATIHLNVPNGVQLHIDSADVRVVDIDGTQRRPDHFGTECVDTSAEALGYTRRCFSLEMNLNSTDYDKLDGYVLHLGYASIGERRFPLNVTFRLDK